MLPPSIEQLGNCFFLLFFHPYLFVFAAFAKLAFGVRHFWGCLKRRTVWGRICLDDLDFTMSWSGLTKLTVVRSYTFTLQKRLNVNKSIYEMRYVQDYVHLFVSMPLCKYIFMSPCLYFNAVTNSSCHQPTCLGCWWITSSETVGGKYPRWFTWFENHSNRFTRWWFQIFFIFTPIWGRFPIWYFSKGLKPPTSLSCWISFDRKKTPHVEDIISRYFKFSRPGCYRNKELVWNYRSW